MRVQKGIRLYTIESDECLNGVFINEHTPGRTCNEILKLKKQKGKDKICGEYICAFVGENINVTDRTSEYTIIIDRKVEITKVGSFYEFKWENFKGYGYKMNDRQIVVHYRSI